MLASTGAPSRRSCVESSKEVIGQRLFAHRQSTPFIQLNSCTRQRDGWRPHQRIAAGPDAAPVVHLAIARRRCEHLGSAELVNYTAGRGGIRISLEGAGQCCLTICPLIAVSCPTQIPIDHRSGSGPVLHVKRARTGTSRKDTHGKREADPNAPHRRNRHMPHRARTPQLMLWCDSDRDVICAPGRPPPAGFRQPGPNDPDSAGARRRCSRPGRDKEKQRQTHQQLAGGLLWFDSAVIDANICLRVRDQKPSSAPATGNLPRPRLSGDIGITAARRGFARQDCNCKQAGN